MGDVKEFKSFLIKKIPTTLWTKFLEKIPRTKNLNDEFISMIEEKSKK